MERKNNRLPIFTERFRKLQGDRSNTEFAEFLEISRQTVGFYCNGDRVPDALTLKQIAEKCNISADWLLGITENPTVDANIKAACKATGLSEKAIKNIKSILGMENRKDFVFSIQNTLNKFLESGFLGDVIRSVAAPIGKGSTDFISRLPNNEQKEVEEYLIKIESALKESFCDDFYISTGSEVRLNYIEEAKMLFSLIIDDINFEY